MEKQKELEQAITDAANAKITALEKKHNEELESIKIEGAKMLLDLTKDSTQKELDLADLEHKERVKEIKTKFKDEADLKARLLKQESEYYEKTRTQHIIEFMSFIRKRNSINCTLNLRHRILKSI